MKETQEHCAVAEAIRTMDLTVMEVSIPSTMKMFPTGQVVPIQYSKGGAQPCKG